MNKGFAHIILIVFGLFLSLMIVGFIFKQNGFTPPVPSDKPKSISDIFMFAPRECGLIIGYPREDQLGAIVAAPIRIAGYANGCDWYLKDNSAGTVQVLDDQGQVISNTYLLTIVQHRAFAPAYFDLELFVTPPKNKRATLLFTNNNTAQPVVKQMPIMFK
jgi:hypothetical protein